MKAIRNWRHENCYDEAEDRNRGLEIMFGYEVESRG